MGPSYEKMDVLPEGKPALVEINNIVGDWLIGDLGYQENMSQGSTLRFEASLPRLPVPDLKDTASRYLKSLRPLLSKSDYARTNKIVHHFTKRGSIGPELQERLQARRDDPNCKNWLYEWWNETAYLSYRDPVVPYVSYFYSHRDAEKLLNSAKKAAALTLAIFEFYNKLERKELEPEYVKGLPLSMESYQWMFHACRMPGEHVDYPVKYERKHPHQYFIVVRKNQFFKVQHIFENEELNVSELEKQFNLIYSRAEKAPAVGALTSENRDHWAVARASLCSAHASNAATLETIQASSFVICLDDSSPTSLEQRAHQYWHGDGSNRWFDKPLQFIVNDNGTSGFMGEHSMMDGTPTHRLNHYVNQQIFTEKINLTDQQIRSDLPEPVALNFHINRDVNEAIDRALVSFKSLISQHNLKVLVLHGYGTEMIKQLKCSPDAFVQMIIQLAYFKMHGICRPTYESAATRRFQQGRTETCRSLSAASVEFCQAMANPEISRERRIESFRVAIDAHVRNITDASIGQGVDRHLFGLRKCLQDGEELPELYTDPAYAYSSRWFLSTSQLSSEFMNGYGWSQVVDEGFGIAYMINNRTSVFPLLLDPRWFLLG